MHERNEFNSTGLRWLVHICPVFFRTAVLPAWYFPPWSKSLRYSTFDIFLSKFPIPVLQPSGPINHRFFPTRSYPSIIYTSVISPIWKFHFQVFSFCYILLQFFSPLGLSLLLSVFSIKVFPLLFRFSNMPLSTQSSSTDLFQYFFYTCYFPTIFFSSKFGLCLR